MKTLQIAFLLSIACFASTADDILIEEADIRHDSANSNNKMPENLKDLDQQQMQLIGVTCVLITKYELYENTNILREIQNKYKEKNKPKIIGKISADIMIECTKNLNFQQASEVFEQISSQELDIKNQKKYLGDFSWKKYQNKKINVKLNDLEKRMIQFAEDFEKSMQEQKAKFDGQQGQDNYQISNDNSLNYQWKLYILSGILFIIIFLIGIFYCLSRSTKQKSQEAPKVEEKEINEDTKIKEKSEVQKKND
eukprot:TRINITY_DN13265_c0_g1_i2.p1 TRINITY_DN13265_c0_g1~~TRINITY_DN13265_c0_g1_i2.p1  ORF type:complete len:253 (-),score=47.31 TRINITY_DN13265_c0_g1_i2:173-931(-)